MYPGNHTESEILSVPRNLKTRPGAPETHLAYITDDEADLLEIYKPDTPHRGPERIPNYDTWGYDPDSGGPVTGGSTADGGGAWSGDVGGTQDEPAPQYSTDQYGIQDTQDLISADLWENQPTDFSTASTPGMTTGFGSWFGANTASTGSSKLVQTTIQNEIDKAVAEQKALHNAGKVKDKYGKVIPWQASMHNKVIQDVFNNLYPKIKQYTEEEFVNLYGEESRGDYIAAMAAMAPGRANYMGAPPPGQTNIFSQNWQSAGGRRSGGPGPHYGGGYYGGRGGSGGGGGSRMQVAGAGGDGHIWPRWGPFTQQGDYIRNLRRANRGGIVSLC